MHFSYPPRIATSIFGLSIAAAFTCIAVLALHSRGADNAVPDRINTTDALTALAQRATSGDPEVSKPAIEQLRAAGPAGLQALLDANMDAVKAHVSGAAPAAKDDAHWQRTSAAIDAVARQKDAYASGLFWYTDLGEAKKAAAASGKPILSLRLLGRLDTEYSCANSRFFRTALYANHEVSTVLREHFVLHWQSVRPVPRITIDFGDGRKIERTITGNSIHYVLNADGEVIDAVPGLYGPKAFLQQLTDAEQAEKKAANLSGSERDRFLRAWHAEKAQQVLANWQADLQRAGVPLVSTGAATPRAVLVPLEQTGVARAGAAAPPAAILAAPRAIGKSVVERPMVLAVTPDARLMESASDDATWAKVAALHGADARLDVSSRVLMARKSPEAAAAAPRARTKLLVESPLVRLVRNFERSIAEDTVRNEYTFHRQIHTWLAAEAGSPQAKLAGDVNALNEKVYADLFLTPSTDPWLGLVPPDTYTALQDGGLCTK